MFRYETGSEVERLLLEERIEYETHEVNIFEFTPIMKKVVTLIREERKVGNHIFVNISCGPSLFSAAALIACMMKGGIPFDVKTNQYMIDPMSCYENERPIGLTKQAKEPVRLPEFSIAPPQPRLVKALGIWKQTFDRKGLMTHSNIIQKLAAHDLIEIEYVDNKPRKKRTVSQKTIMKYQRNFLESWQKEGWIEKQERGRYNITSKGEIILEIFGE